MGEMAEYYSGDYGDVSDINGNEPDAWMKNGPIELSYDRDVHVSYDCNTTTAGLLAEYGYGIVDRDGKPYFNEDFCVSTDLPAIRDLASDLNEDGPEYNKGYPYRVVRLLYQEME